MKRLIALTDSMVPWHSFWVRFGQYAGELGIEIQITEDSNELKRLEQGDTLFLYRFLPEWGWLDKTLIKLKTKGVKVITDIDDCVWQAPLGWDRRRQTLYTCAVRNCDLITCSTTALKELLNVMFPTKPIDVVRNSAPDLSQKKKDSNDVTICWSGAPWTREQDLAVLKPLAHWIKARDISVNWHHLGNAEGRLSFADAVGIPEDRVKKTRLSGYKEYLNSLSGDIGIAPIASRAFNTYKSEVKIVEYSAAGMAWIASDTRAYRELCERWGIKGRLCRSPKDWIKNLEELLDQKILEQEKTHVKTMALRYESRKDVISQWKRIIQRVHYLK